jgi:hypothetical protein
MEEELVQVKLREAEAQLAIKELQKTIHVLNLEYQEFLSNRSAVLASINGSNNEQQNNNGNSNNNNTSTNTSIFTNLNGPTINRSEFDLLEEELLKVKMREAEEVSELKATNLKLMQFETEVYAPHLEF